MPGIDVKAYLDQLGEALPYVPPVPAAKIKALHGKGDLGAVVKLIRATMNVGVGLRLHWTSDAPPPHIPSAPAWIRSPQKMPYYGTPAFKALTLDVFVRKQFAQNLGYDQFAIMIAHELSHVVLDSIEHPLRHDEKAVDLTAMLLGFSRLYSVAADKITGLYVKKRTSLGYLSPSELRAAVRLLVPARERSIDIARSFAPLMIVITLIGAWIGAAKAYDLWRLHQKIATEADTINRHVPTIVNPSLVLNGAQAGLFSLTRIYLLTNPRRLPDSQALRSATCDERSEIITEGATYIFEYRNAAGQVVAHTVINSCP